MPISQNSYTSFYYNIYSSILLIQLAPFDLFSASPITQLKKMQLLSFEP